MQEVVRDKDSKTERGRKTGKERWKERESFTQRERERERETERGRDGARERRSEGETERVRTIDNRPKHARDRVKLKASIKCFRKWSNPAFPFLSDHRESKHLLYSLHSWHVRRTEREPWLSTDHRDRRLGLQTP